MNPWKIAIKSHPVVTNAANQLHPVRCFAAACWSQLAKWYTMVDTKDSALGALNVTVVFMWFYRGL